MKFRNWFLYILLFVGTAFNAQIKNPVKFKLEVKDIGNSQYEAILHATMESGWHIYSKDIPEDTGIPTEYAISGRILLQLENLLKLVKSTKNSLKLSEVSLSIIQTQHNSNKNSN